MGTTRQAFERVPIIDNNEPLVDISDYGLSGEPVYFRQGYSPNSRILLRKGVVERLVKANNSLRSKYQYQIKVWDGYRPRLVQDAVYQEYYSRVVSAHPNWDERQLEEEVEKFVTKATTQERIPPHSTGGAVDLTLTTENGELLNMGTAFDHFGPEAAPFYYEKHGNDKDARRNRGILQAAMLEVGFSLDEDEWWHFNFGNQLWAKSAHKDHAVYGEVNQELFNTLYL